MLAAFDRTVAKCPDGLRQPEVEGATKDGSISALPDHFSSVHQGAVTDADEGVPFFWGTDPENHLIISDEEEIMKKHCGKHFAPFPKGCFFTSSGGLQSFEHPLSEVKPVPRVDSNGDVCGTIFLVDTKVKRQTSMPRVGSGADWSINSN